MGRDEIVGREVGESVCVCVSVTVVGCVLVDVDVFVRVTVLVRWMNEVSKIEVVVSMVLVTKTVTSSVMNTVTSLVAVTVISLGPLGMRGARVMVGMVRDVMVGWAGGSSLRCRGLRLSGDADVRGV